jgi:polyisoprenoid-binding protein YceI
MKNIFTLIFCYPLICFATPEVYKPEISSGKNIGVKFTIPYTFGTHEGVSHIILGEVTIDTSNPSVSTGEFIVPINSFKTNDDERDCHLREALGLNYQNSVIYPMINFKILSVTSQDSIKQIPLDRESMIDVEGQWTIHGITKQVKLPMKIIPNGKKFRTIGEFPFSLSDYNIIVKSNKILFVTIGVKDQLKVLIDFSLAPTT